MNAVTVLGDPILIVLIGLAGVTYGLARSNPLLTNAFAVAMAAYAFSGLLKEFIHRTRPDTVYVTTMKFKSYSFPSAHAFGSVVIYGLLAYLAYQNLPAPWNIIIPAVLLPIVIAIGISRVYLGAHYPTDVIGGWLLGAAALFLILKYVLKMTG